MLETLIYYVTYPLPFHVWFPLLLIACFIAARIMSRPTKRAGGLAHAPEGGQSPASEIPGESGKPLTQAVGR